MRLRTKITLLVSLGMVFSAAIGILLVERGLSSVFDDHADNVAELVENVGRTGLEERSQVLAKQLAATASNPLSELDLALLADIVTAARRRDGVEVVEILNASSRLVADGTEKAYLKNIHRRDPGRRRASQSRKSGFRWRTNRLTAWAPIVLGGDQLGAVWLELSLDNYRAVQDIAAERRAAVARQSGREARRQALFVMPPVILLALSLGFLLAFGISRRVQRIADAAARVAAGDSGVRVEVTSRDELGQVAGQFNKMLVELEDRRAQALETERVHKELELARRIQLSVLPQKLIECGDLRAAGLMEAATEVGGDYFDILACGDTCWLGVGDVSGHGLTAGLTMLMVQSAVSALVRSNPEATPAEVLDAANQAIQDNVRNRLQIDDHMTITLFRCEQNGRVTFAGAHEDILVIREQSGKVERIETSGTWLGVIKDISEHLPEAELILGPGDYMVLHTDGIIESKNDSAQMYDIEGLTALLERRAPGATPNEIARNVLDDVRQFTDEMEDDRTIVILRRS